MNTALDQSRRKRRGKNGNNRNEKVEDDEKPEVVQAAAGINLLPDPILEDILSRIPAKMLTRCKSVSKTWISIINSLTFSKTHISRSPICPLIVFNDNLGKKTNRIIYLVEGQSLSDFDHKMGNYTTIRFPDLTKGRASKSYLRGMNTNATSCQGLVCWATCRGGGDIFIGNPITGEYIILNHQHRNERNEIEEASVFIGLGFSRVTKTFELLKMTLWRVDDSSRSLSWWPELCTAGHKSFRRVGDRVKSRICFWRKIWEIVYTNGAMYWIYAAEPYLCCFDFDRTLFKVISLPEMNGVTFGRDSFVTDYKMTLGVLNDDLCLSLVSPKDKRVEIWVMATSVGSQSSWSKLYDIETLPTSLNERIVATFLFKGRYSAVKYLDNGKVLIHHWRLGFIVYDPITKTNINESLIEFVDQRNFQELELLNAQVVPHVPSLIPLKDSLNIEDESHVTILKASSRRRQTRGRAKKRRGVSRG